MPHTVNLDHLLTLGRTMRRKDCLATRRWLRAARFERYADQGAALASAERALKPRAVDWESILAFLEQILPLIMPFFIK